MSLILLGDSIMCNIVKFRPGSGPPRPEAPRIGLSAEIFFFTGVRYERPMVSPPQDGARRRRTKAPLMKSSPKKDTGRGRKRLA
jgi:hypothetical protein